MCLCRCKRRITGLCGSFTSPKSYATAIDTTRIINKKVYWKDSADPCWKRVERHPPPKPSNGAPTRVFYNHNRDRIYRYISFVVVVVVVVFLCMFVILIDELMEYMRHVRVYTIAGNTTRCLPVRGSGLTTSCIQAWKTSTDADMSWWCR